MYKLQGRYDEAEPLYKKAVQLKEKILGKEHPDTLVSIGNLALLYRSQGRYGEAEPLLKQVLQLSEKVLGKEHPNTLGAIISLALLYHSQGHYAEAEPLYKQALQLSEKALGKEHPVTLDTQTSYAVLMINMRRNAAALRLFKQAEQRLLSRSFQELYSTATDRIRRTYLKTISRFQDFVLTLAATSPKIANQRYAANVILRWKQVYAQESAYQHRILHMSHDPEIMAMKAQANRLRSSLSQQMYHRQGGASIDTLWNGMNLVEQQIRHVAKRLKPDLEVVGADLDQVVGQLPQGSALIEFRMYKRYNFKLMSMMNFTLQSIFCHLISKPSSRSTSKIWGV